MLHYGIMKTIILTTVVLISFTFCDGASAQIITSSKMQEKCKQAVH